MQIHILMTVKLQFWTATDVPTNPPRKLWRLPLSLYSTTEHDTSAVKGRIALMIKQARKLQMQEGYSKYGLCMNIFFVTEILANLQPPKLPLDEATIPWRGRLKFRTVWVADSRIKLLNSLPCDILRLKNDESNFNGALRRCVLLLLLLLLLLLFILCNLLNIFSLTAIIIIIIIIYLSRSWATC